MLGLIEYGNSTPPLYNEHSVLTAPLVELKHCQRRALGYSRDLATHKAATANITSFALRVAFSSPDRRAKKAFGEDRAAYGDSCVPVITRCTR